MNPGVVSFLRGTFCLALFVLGLCGGCWAIRGALPFPEVPVVTPKLEHYEAHRDEYDTIFLGTSHIYQGVVPAIFDPLAASEGLPTHSYNAAVSGLRPPEDAYFLDRLLRHPPKHLRWAFIELSVLRTTPDPSRIGTVRDVYWHDTPRLWILFRRTLVSLSAGRKSRWRRTLENAMEPLGDFGHHLFVFLENQTNLGRGVLYTARFVDPDLRPPPPPSETLGEDLAGWMPSGMPEEMTGERLTAYEKEMAYRRKNKQADNPGDPVSQQALEAMIAKVEKLGATPVLVIAPTTHKVHFSPSPERAGKTLVLDFSDIERFPELFEERHRLDTDHLNTAGAQVFTRLFVKTWAEAVNHRP